MQKAGSVRTIAQGLLVVRAPGPDVPDIGTDLVDENLDEVGQVVDIFGPVDRPYLAVKAYESVHPAGHLHKSLYIT